MMNWIHSPPAQIHILWVAMRWRNHFCATTNGCPSINENANVCILYVHCAHINNNLLCCNIRIILFWPHISGMSLNLFSHIRVGLLPIKWSVLFYQTWPSFLHNSIPFTSFFSTYCKFIDILWMHWSIPFTFIMWKCFLHSDASCTWTRRWKGIENMHYIWIFPMST